MKDKEEGAEVARGRLPLPDAGVKLLKEREGRRSG